MHAHREIAAHYLDHSTIESELKLMKDEFASERLTAMSNALDAWTRCERAACRRAGKCKGQDELLPRCLPIVTGVFWASVASRALKVPPPALAAGQQSALGRRLEELTQRTIALVEHNIEAMEREVAKAKAQE